jgi:hypothetical protein
MKPIEITILPDGRYTLATNPRQALSEKELRKELAKSVGHPAIVEDLVRQARAGFSGGDDTSFSSSPIYAGEPRGRQPASAR